MSDYKPVLWIDAEVVAKTAGREEMRKAVLEVLTQYLKDLDEQYEPSLQYFETVLEYAIADVKEIK